ncbi:MAG: DUF721 domain-containing protein [Alphaproteobacteria bacterium]|nr:DUF721 domain-containing protein [Alphaproteobacteria bacterium]
MAAKSTSNGTSAKPGGIVPGDRRTRRAEPVAKTVDKLTKGLLGRQGFTHGAIVTKWPDIVGEHLARHTQPEKIVFSRDGVSGGTLHLKTDSGALAIELMHLEPQILERINAFFGYRAVVRIKLLQGPLPRAKDDAPAPPPQPLSAEEARNLAAAIAGVDDPELFAALERLGQAIKRRPKQNNGD